jgi:hypothetical protein
VPTDDAITLDNGARPLKESGTNERRSRLPLRDAQTFSDEREGRLDVCRRNIEIKTDRT